MYEDPDLGNVSLEYPERAFEYLERAEEEVPGLYVRLASLTRETTSQPVKAGVLYRCTLT
jgi:hypothetical protein